MICFVVQIQNKSVFLKFYLEVIDIYHSKLKAYIMMVWFTYILKRLSQ